jgi:hypothetical protein
MADESVMTDEQFKALEKRVRTNGRAIMQANVKLSELLDKALDKEPIDSEANPPSFELLADLIEGLDRGIEALAAEAGKSGQTIGFFAALFGKEKASSRVNQNVDSVLEGLNSLRQRIINHLCDAGINIAPMSGEFDAELHCAISADGNSAEGALVKTARRGYFREERGRKIVLRSALVVVGKGGKEK